MRRNVLQSAVLLVCATTTWSCSGTTMPSSPSALTSQASQGAGGVKLSKRDDATTPTPAPGPANPAPDPNAPIDPNAPPVDPNAPPTPMQVMIAIVGTFGMNAFLPNPIQAVVGNTIVWQNNDVRTHHIVLDDGTDLGEVAPGQATAPMTLMTPTATFHCLIHPTMVGSISPDPPPVPDPSMPTDPYMPPPDDGYYGYY